MTASSRPIAFLLNPLNLIPALYVVVWGTVAMFFRPAGDFGVETDFYGDFAHYSRIWLEEGPTLMNGFRGPFYYLLLGVTGKVTGDPFLAAKLLSVIGSALGLGFLGRLIHSLWGWPQAMVAMLFVASNPIFAEYSYRACSDPVFWAMLVAMVWLVMRDGDHPGRDWMVAGALAGLAYLTRYNGVALVPAALLAAFIAFRSPRTAVLRFAGFFVMWVIVVAPWALYCLRETGDPLWNNNFSNVAVNVYVDNPGSASSGNFMGEVRFTSMSEVLRVDPGAFVSTLLRNSVRNVWFDLRDLLGAPWAVVGLAGLVLGGRSWLTRRRLAFAAMAVMVYGVLLPAFYNPRFMLALLVWWGAAAGGVVSLARFLPRRSAPAKTKKEAKRNRPSSRWQPQPMHILLGILTVGAVIGVALNIRSAQDPLRHGGLAIEIRNLARQVRASGITVGRLTPVAASKPHVGYYLDAPTMAVALGDVNDLRQSGAHFLLISGIEVLRYPGLNPLWLPRDESVIPTGLTLAGSTIHESSAGRRAATLYAIDNPLPYTPPGKTRPMAVAQDPAPGFGRIDDLRRRLADWYIRWNSNQADIEGLLDRMDPAVQETYYTLVLRGDAALETDQPQAAIQWYTRAMAAAPDSLTLGLRRSAAHTLAGDDAAAEDDLMTVLGSYGLAVPQSSAEWYRLGSILLYRREHAQAFPFMHRANLSPSPTKEASRGMAYCWGGLGRNDTAMELLRAHVGAYPDDLEAAGLLRTLMEYKK